MGLKVKGISDLLGVFHEKEQWVAHIQVVGVYNTFPKIISSWCLISTAKFVLWVNRGSLWCYWPDKDGVVTAVVILSQDFVFVDL